MKNKSKNKILLSVISIILGAALMGIAYRLIMYNFSTFLIFVGAILFLGGIIFFVNILYKKDKY